MADRARTRLIGLRRVGAAVLALLATVPLVAQIPADLDYTQWRGRDRDGAASGFVVPSSWPMSLTRRWTVEVGEGYGTPLVIGERVYVFTRRDGQEVMIALDAGTGAERWHTGYLLPYTPSQPTVAHGSGPKATPLFHEGRLFALGITGILSAFDPANGALLWQSPPPAEPPFYSAAASPVGDAGLVVAHPGNYGPLTAFDTRSGTVRWTAGDGGFFMSPLIVTFDGVRQVVSVTQGGVIGVSVPDGRLLWTHPWAGGGQGGTMPILHAGTIIVSAGGSGTMAFRPALRGGQWATETLWTTDAVSMYLSNPVVVGGTLFGLLQRDRGRFFALDARDGAVLWLGPPRQAANTAVVSAGDLLFLLNDDGRLIVATTSRTALEVVARYTVSEGATWAQPAISGNRIFVKDAGTLALWTID